MKIFTFFLGLITLGYCQNQYTMCVYPTDYGKCDELKRGYVGCEKVQDSVECANKILNGKVDFGTFYPEQTFLFSQFAKNEAVIGDIRAKDMDHKKNSFQMVVVVKKDYPGGLDKLQGKRYCHPGFAHEELWTPRLRKEFEYVLFNDKLIENCDHSSNMTMLEKEIKFLSEYFGDSCRPGPWTPDPKLDDELKRKYPKLCSLCDSDCSAGQNASLKCLNEKNGDIAYTSHMAAFNMRNRQEYRLLCRNGEVREITYNITDECSWRNQPWSLLVGQRDKVSSIQNSLRSWLDVKHLAITVAPSPFYPNQPLSPLPRLGYDPVSILADVLTRGESHRINILTDTTSVVDYLGRQGQTISLEHYSNCPMRWCVISDVEQKKCEWLSKASSIIGIEPKLSCIRGQHIYDCFVKIQKNNADIMAIDSNYGYLARKMSMNNVLYNQIGDSDKSTIIALIKSSSDIKSFKDLKNKKACFPEYRGLAWLSFIEAARKHKVIKNNCDFTKSVKDFLDSACAPGATDTYHYQTDGVDNSKLCAACASNNCEASDINPLFGNFGVLKCLESADVGFIEKQDLDDNENYDSNQYKVLCMDETVKNINEITSSCPLSETVDSEVIARMNDSRKADYRNALLQMDKYFGTAYKNDQTMQMFKSFEDVKNVMFKDSVLGFDDDSSNNQYVQNYIDLFKKLDECTNSAFSINISYFTLFFSILFVFSRNV